MDGERVKEIAGIVHKQTGADPGTQHIIEGALLSVLWRSFDDVEKQCFDLIRHDVSLKHRVDSLKQIAMVMASKKSYTHARIKEISDGDNS